MKVFRKIVLWMLVGLLSLGQLQRIELQYFGLNFAVYLHDIVITAFIFHILFTDPITYFRYIFESIKNNKIIVILLGITTTSFITNFIFTPDFTQLAYVFRLIVYILFGMLLAFLIKNKKYESEYLGFQFFSIGLFSLFLGFLQFILIKDTRFLSILGWDDHYARLISTYFDPTFTGIIFVVSLLIGLSNKFLQNKYLKLVQILLFSWGIILTFSRASYLALIIALAIVFLYSIETKKLVFGFLSFLFLIFLAPKPFGEGVNLLRTSTITARTNAFTSQLLHLSPQTVLIGNGLFSKKNSLDFQYISSAESQDTSVIVKQIIPSHSRMPDNVFINILLSTGIFGLLAFLVFISHYSRTIKKKNIYLFACFIALLVHSQFSNSLFQPFVLLVFLGAVVTLDQTKKAPKTTEKNE